jgi:tetratricopeptide (TPR) repeat protein
MSASIPTGDMQDLVRAGIAAAKAGRRQEARDLLIRAVNLDERNVAGWLWLSSVVDSLDDREVCLENVLTLQPDHQAARLGLEYVRRQKAAQTAPAASQETSGSVSSTSAETPDYAPAEPPAEAMTPEPERVASFASPAGAILGRSAAPATEEIAPPAAEADDFEGDYRCPYCAAQTTPADKRCPQCGKALTIRFRKRERASAWLILVLVFQGINVVSRVAAFGVILFAVPYFAQMFGQIATLQPSLRLYSSASPLSPGNIAQLSTYLAVITLVALLWSAAVFIALYVRWRPVYYYLLAVAALSLALGIVLLFLTWRAPLGAIGAIISGIVQFAVVLQLEDDFAYETRRLVLQLDPQATSGPALMSSAQYYAKQRMWANVVLHLRRALGRDPDNVEAHLGMATAYFNMQRYDQAAAALEKARRIAPETPRILIIERALAEARRQAA